jgi:phosphorylated CTD-interacting factor 1
MEKKQEVEEEDKGLNRKRPAGTIEGEGEGEGKRNDESKDKMMKSEGIDDQEERRQARIRRFGEPPSSSGGDSYDRRNNGGNHHHHHHRHHHHRHHHHHHHRQQHNNNNSNNNSNYNNRRQTETADETSVRIEAGNILPSEELGPAVTSGIPIYDLRVNGNGPQRTASAVSTDFMHVSPAVELMRAEMISRLRGFFFDLVKRHVGVVVAKDTFTRWIFAQLAVSETSSTGDPLLRFPDLALDVLSDQILEALPASSYISWNQRGNPDEIRRVASVWLDVLDREWIAPLRSNSDQVFLERKKQVADVIATARANWLALSGSRHRDDDAKVIEDNFAQLRLACAPYLKLVTESKIKEILRIFCDECRRRINEFKERVVAISSTESTEERNQITIELIESMGRKNPPYYLLRFRNDEQPILVQHARKLRCLFDIHSPNRSDDQFIRSLYSLLRRYQTFFGVEDNIRFAKHRESAAMHAAAPSALFVFFRDRLSIAHECFGSPLNCYFRSFCSAFPDTDSVFGSFGSFFRFSPRQGSFEVGPPYTVEVMERTARHCVNLLTEATGPMSMVVFVPDWRKPLQPAQQIMEASQFTRHWFVLAGGDHAYVVGDQHLPREARHFILPFNTAIYVMQNDEGAAKWPFDKSVEDEIRQVLHQACQLKGNV